MEMFDELAAGFGLLMIEAACVAINLALDQKPPDYAMAREVIERLPRE